MSEYILLLLFLPLAFAITILFNSVRVRNITTYLFVSFLALMSLKLFFESTIIEFNFNHAVHILFIVVDFILMGYFLYQGVKYKDRLISIFAVVQLILFVLFLQFSPTNISSDIFVDKISYVMLLVINIVGGIIILYSLKYIQSEDVKDCKKNLFISILFFFLGVMNLTVTTNNIEIFFLGFELTTLCSYILIRYRGDDLAWTNAKRALWMNQIGGVAILFSLIASAYYYDTIYFDRLLEVVDDTFLIPISLLIIAAFVKGASIPFDKWLLGAMVAPTPVSAILHSATMVKIAPYLILKIAPAFPPWLSMSVVLFGSFIFLSGSLLALSRDYFKEILGYSTIALLGFMMAMAAINTQESINIALIVIVFHAISKALLFLQAGILEKVYHLKYLQDINYLSSYSKFIVFCIIIGFASLTLPPFGVFIGKFESIRLISSLIENNIFYLISLIFILMGSVILTLLYFKVITKLIPQDKKEHESLPIDLTYKITSLMLIGLLFLGINISYQYDFMNQFDILVAVGIFAISFVMLYFIDFKKIKKVSEYNCGEKDEVKLSAYYFYIPNLYKKIIFYTAITLMIFVLCLGVV